MEEADVVNEKILYLAAHGQSQNGHVSPEMVASYVSSFAQFRHLNDEECIREVVFTTSQGDKVTIFSLDYGTQFCGAAFFPFDGVFPTDTAVGARTCRAALEGNRCLWLHLGIGLHVHPYILGKLARHANDHIVTHGANWRYCQDVAETEAADEFYSSEVRLTMSTYGAHVAFDSLKTLFDMFPDVLGDMSIAVVHAAGYGDGEYDALHILNSKRDSLAAQRTNSMIVLFLLRGHYTLHPGTPRRRVPSPHQTSPHLTSPHITSPYTHPLLPPPHTHTSPHVTSPSLPPPPSHTRLPLPLT
jgi:hypothetical protein